MLHVPVFWVGTRESVPGSNRIGARGAEFQLVDGCMVRLTNDGQNVRAGNGRIQVRVLKEYSRRDGLSELGRQGLLLISAEANLLQHAGGHVG